MEWAIEKAIDLVGHLIEHHRSAVGMLLLAAVGAAVLTQSLWLTLLVVAVVATGHAVQFGAGTIIGAFVYARLLFGLVLRSAGLLS